MARFLISVGGSGQHVALAMTRLVYMGALQNDIQLIAIDPDHEGAISKTLRKPANMAVHPLLSGQVHPPFDANALPGEHFEGMFVDEQNPIERDLFEALFDEPMAQIRIKEGMFGTPCVGATVFAQGAQSNTFGNILASVGSASAVTVCGSVIGGTGAGITHKLVTELKRKFGKGMFGIFMLPWFKLPSGTGGGNTIDNERIERNASHGIKYFYERTIPALDSTVLIGYPEGHTHQVLRPLMMSGGVGQETPHYLHLVACYSFAMLESMRKTNPNVRAYYVSHMLGDQESWLLDHPWENGACFAGRRPDGKGDDGIPRTPPMSPAPTLRERIRAHQVLLELLTFLTESKQKEDLTKFYDRGMFAAFSGRTTPPAGEDLHASIKTAQPDEKSQKRFVEDMLGEFAQIAGEVRFCVDWAVQVFGDRKLLGLRGGDTLLDRVLGQDAGLKWDTLKTMWLGKRLGPGERTSATVAREYARFVLEAALNRQFKVV